MLESTEDETGGHGCRNVEGVACRRKPPKMNCTGGHECRHVEGVPEGNEFF